MESLDNYIKSLETLYGEGVIDVKPTLLTYKAGEIIFHGEEPAHEIFGVHTGKIQLVHYLENGQMVNQYAVQPGMWFGEDGLFKQTYQSCAIATQPTQLITVPTQAFMLLLRHNSQLSLSFIRQLTEQLHITKKMMTLRCIRSAYERVLTYLNILTPTNSSTVLLNCSIKEIAEQICLTPEVVSRTLRKLQDDGIIQRHHRKITFLEP